LNINRDRTLTRSFSSCIVSKKKKENHFVLFF